MWLLPVKYFDNLAFEHDFTCGRTGGNKLTEFDIAHIGLGYLYPWQSGVPVKKEA